MVLDVPLLSHFPLDLVLYLRYKTPIGLTL
jgi:hypothetical protein